MTTTYIETKGKAFLIIDKQHIFTFPHFKMISPSSSTQCLQCEDVPIKNYRRTCLFRNACQENTLPSVPALVKPLTNLTFYTSSSFFFFLIAPFVLHISCHCTRMGGKYGLWACNFKCRYFHLCLSSMKLNPVVQCAVIPNQEGRGGSNDLHVLTLL